MMKSTIYSKKCNRKIGLLLSSLFLASCVYFNTFYNAKVSFKQAQHLIDLMDYREISIPAEAKALLDDAILNSNIVLNNHSDSKFVEEAYYIISVSLFLKEDYKGAKEYLNELIDKFPESKYSIEAGLWVSLCELRIGNIITSKDLVDKINKKKTNKYHRYLSNTVYAELALEDSNLLSAYDYYNKAINNSATDMQKIKIYNKLIKISDTNKDYPNLLIFLDQIYPLLSTDKEKKEIKLLSIEYNKKLKRYDYLINEIEKMLNESIFNDIRMDLFVELGKVYYNTKDYITSKEIFNEIISVHLDEPRGIKKALASTAYYYLGRINLINNFDFVLAKEEFDKSKEVYSKSKHGKLSKTLIKRLEEFENIMEEYSYSIDEDLADSLDSQISDSLLFNIAQMYHFDFNQIDSAVSRYTELVGRFPESKYRNKTILVLSKVDSTNNIWYNIINEEGLDNESEGYLQDDYDVDHYRALDLLEEGLHDEVYPLLKRNYLSNDNKESLYYLGYINESYTGNIEDMVAYYIEYINKGDNEEKIEEVEEKLGHYYFTFSQEELVLNSEKILSECLISFKEDANLDSKTKGDCFFHLVNTPSFKNERSEELIKKYPFEGYYKDFDRFNTLYRYEDFETTSSMFYSIENYSDFYYHLKHIPINEILYNDLDSPSRRKNLLNMGLGDELFISPSEDLIEKNIMDHVRQSYDIIKNNIDSLSSSDSTFNFESFSDVIWWNEDNLSDQAELINLINELNYLDNKILNIDDTLPMVAPNIYFLNSGNETVKKIKTGKIKMISDFSLYSLLKHVLPYTHPLHLPDTLTAIHVQEKLDKIDSIKQANLTEDHIDEILNHTNDFLMNKVDMTYTDNNKLINGISLYRLLKQSLPYINALNLPDTLTAELLKEKLYQDEYIKNAALSSDHINEILNYANSFIMYTQSNDDLIEVGFNIQDTTNQLVEAELQKYLIDKGMFDGIEYNYVHNKIRQYLIDRDLFNHPFFTFKQERIYSEDGIFFINMPSNYNLSIYQHITNDPNHSYDVIDLSWSQTQKNSDTYDNIAFWDFKDIRNLELRDNGKIKVNREFSYGNYFYTIRDLDNNKSHSGSFIILEDPAKRPLSRLFRHDDDNTASISLLKEYLTEKGLYKGNFGSIMLNDLKQYLSVTPRYNGSVKELVGKDSNLEFKEFPNGEKISNASLHQMAKIFMKIRSFFNVGKNRIFLSEDEFKSRLYLSLTKGRHRQLNYSKNKANEVIENANNYRIYLLNDPNMIGKIIGNVFLYDILVDCLSIIESGEDSMDDQIKKELNQLIIEGKKKYNFSSEELDEILIYVHEFRNHVSSDESESHHLHHLYNLGFTLSLDYTINYQAELLSDYNNILDSYHLSKQKLEEIGDKINTHKRTLLLYDNVEIEGKNDTLNGVEEKDLPEEIPPYNFENLKLEEMDLEKLKFPSK